MSTLKSTNNAVYAIHYHLVLVTKYRRKCLTKPIMDRLAEIAGDTCNKFGCTLTEINGESDHAHMLLELIPAVHPVRLVNSLKTVSSRLLRKEYASHFNRYYSKPVLWSPSYCLITCGGAPLAIIQQYIQNQQEIQ